MINLNSEEYARKNPIRATISNAGASIYHASNTINVSLQATTKVAQLCSNALDQLLVEQAVELEQAKAELLSSSATKLGDL